jgi:hypothetical protein
MSPAGGALNSIVRRHSSSTMICVRVTIERMTDSAFPGWVRCSLLDASGKNWQFVEKVPVIGGESLSEASSYPQTRFVACQLVAKMTDATGRDLCVVDTSIPWGIEATDGTTQFTVLASQLENRPGAA